MYNGRAGGEVERSDIKGEERKTERAKRKTSEGKERRKNR